MFTPDQITALKQYIANSRPGWLGKFLYYCLPYRKKVVLANMRLALGAALNAAEIKKLAQGFYSHIARLIWENIQFPFLSSKQIQQRVKVEGVHHLQQLGHKGAILLTGHLGNWELVPIGFMLQYPEYQGKISIIRKKIDAAQPVEKILFRRYNALGLEVIPSKKAMIKVYKGLKREHSMIFVVDQHASLTTKDGILVDFFGTPAGTYKSPALLAQNTQAPVLPLKIYRRADKKHVLEILPPLSFIQDEDPARELMRNTRHYNAVIEQFILEHPDQWLWSHRRWKKSG